MKKETLKEDVELFFRKKDVKNCTLYKAAKFGTKWQQERSYSEEDLRIAFTEGHDSARMKGSYKSNGTFEEDWILWFNKFKKK